MGNLRILAIICYLFFISPSALANWTTFEKSIITQGAFISQLFSPDGKAIWAVSANGAFEFLNGEWVPRYTAKGGVQDHVRRAIATPDGDVWITTLQAGLVQLRGGDQYAKPIRHDQRSGALSSDWILDARGTRDAIWVITDDRKIAHLNRRTNTWRHYPMQNHDLASWNGEMALLHPARDGSIWIALGDAGLGHLQGEALVVHRSPGGSIDFNASSKHYFEDDGGALWIGLKGGGLSRFADGAWRFFGAADGLSQASDVRIIQRLRGDIVAITEEGTAYRLAGSQWHAINSDSGAPQVDGDSRLKLRGPTHVVTDPSGSLWVGTTSGHAARLSPSGWQDVIKLDSAARTMAVAKDGSVWIGTRRGVYRFNGTVWRMPQSGGAINPTEFAVVDHGRGEVWIRSLDERVYRYLHPSGELSAPQWDNGKRTLTYKIETDHNSGRLDEWKLVYKMRQGDQAWPPHYSEIGFGGDGKAHLASLDIRPGPLDIEALAIDSDGALMTNRLGRIHAVDVKPPLAAYASQLASRSGFILLLLSTIYWMAIALLYPKSSRIQAICLWNPSVRRLTSLWLFDSLVLFVPSIRKFVLAPFRSALLGDAISDKAVRYFHNLELNEIRAGNDRGPRQLIETAITQVQGHQLLLGPSGSGKTFFVKQLIVQANEFAAFVEARHCTDGVTEAIARLLPGHINDKALLEKLIYGGGLAIVIDGLNEVSADVRNEISRFIRKNPRANVLITSQHLRWIKPTGMKTYELLPLSPAQIAAYLEGGSNEGVRDYAARCRSFLSATIFSPNEVVRDASIEALSTPYDVDLAINLLRRSETPSLSRMQGQFIGILARQYQEEFGRGLDLACLAETAYLRRKEDRNDVGRDRLDPETLEYLWHARLLKKQMSSEPLYTFRHDKVQDFLVAAHMGPMQALWEEHVTDPRFVGAFVFLVENLEPLSAQRLLSKLALIAAKSQEHTAFDAFVLGLERAQQLRVDSVSPADNGTNGSHA